MTTPKRTPEPPDLGDPLIDEVRAIRQRIWDECGHDWGRYFQRLREVEQRDASGAASEPGSTQSQRDPV